MTSEVLRKLEAKGLIVRTVDAADTRARRLRVTEQGADLAVRAIAVVEAVDAAFFRATPDPAALLDMLRPLARRDRAAKAGRAGRAGRTTGAASGQPGRVDIPVI
jgi:DNA-binding MarR family transcriptional regulator